MRAGFGWSAGWSVLAALGMAAAACSEPVAPRRPVLLTTSDLAALSLQPVPPTAIVEGYGLPGGMRLDRIIKADSATHATLVTRDTLTEEYRSAYVTTEVWAGFDEVWVQPLYVAVTGYDPDSGRPQRAKSAIDDQWHPIFGVGPDSPFYSPYWQTVYFGLGGHDLASFRSVRDVLSRGVDLRPGGAHAMVLAPRTVAAPQAPIVMVDGKMVVSGPSEGSGLLDGMPEPFLDFGIDTFTWNEELVVEEAPIFVWVVRDGSGELRQLDLPTVAGTGPLYANRPAKLVGDQPRYGSYWRIYTVEIPRGAGVFAPKPYKDLRDGMDALGVSYLYTLPYEPMVDAAAASTYAAFAGRVLSTPDCVADRMKIDPFELEKGPVRDAACHYIDSQPEIEALVPSEAIKRTDILVTCPFVNYRETPVVPAQP